MTDTKSTILEDLGLLPEGEELFDETSSELSDGRGDDDDE